ncbi:hypothetical protein [Thermococcus sp.]|uniref:hypothetical protein n=1 Tax=Thermococcus sp. TaxID=35749 RepID=UPI002607CA6A|nr:hypothetical protein [Thermococcus sp.]
MATVKTAFVKYSNESTVDYKVNVRFNVLNTKTHDFYPKMTILSAGNLNWGFADGSTEKDYALPANSTLQVSEDLTPGTAPTETTKDTVTLKLEFYKDSARTVKEFEQTVIVEISVYIQNSDGTWTSSSYPNESDIVYDYFDFSSLTSPVKTDITGVNGKVTLHPYTWGNGSDRYEYVGYPGRYSPYYLLIHQWDDNRLHMEFHNVGDRFVSYVVTMEQGSLDSAEWLGAELKRFPNTTSFFLSSIGLPTNGGSTTKVLIMSKNPYVPYSYSKAKWGGGHDIQISLDGVYVFNPLP